MALNIFIFLGTPADVLEKICDNDPSVMTCTGSKPLDDDNMDRRSSGAPDSCNKINKSFNEPNKLAYDNPVLIIDGDISKSSKQIT